MAFTWFTVIMFAFLGIAAIGIFMSIFEGTKWKTVYRESVWEYQEHTDGRRRAVRIESGQGSAINQTWIEMGDRIDVG